jgi:hypothetical protein
MELDMILKKLTHNEAPKRAKNSLNLFKNIITIILFIIVVSYFCIFNNLVLEYDFEEIQNNFLIKYFNFIEYMKNLKNE